MATWQLQDAKNKFSALVDRAVADGPQIVTKHGRPAVVVLSVEEFERLAGPRPDFKEFLASFPAGDIPLGRSTEPARKVEL